MPAEKSPLADRIRLGCASWSYPDWLGSFYPPGTPSSDFLPLYSKTFDLVEADSTFYRVPPPAVVANWRKNVPEGFLFTAKFPKRITHDKKLRNLTDELDYFYRSIGELREKLGALLIQLPPSLKADKDLPAMKDLLDRLDGRYRHAVEFRHKSWFAPAAVELLRDRNVSMAWATTQYLETPTEITSDFVYLRMVGDRALTKFDRVQRDKTDDMKAWKGKLEDKAGDMKQVFVFFNNHFAGFGPGSANEFRRLLGLAEVQFPLGAAGQVQTKLV